jgi:N6-L-threonylcarbamoyladenine synthase
VAATAGPGLIGGLLVGATLGKGIAAARGLPYLAVNHLEAHALTPRLPGLHPGGLPFPYLLLLLSGGHCQCVAVEGVGRHRRLGTTLDDAVGEAFDKAAKLLGLPWPGGPALERLAALGEPGRVPLPRPLLGRPGCDFSWSGLKTAVAQATARLPGDAPEGAKADIAAAFQASVAAVLADRAAHALAMLPGANALVIAGGVAANGTVRAALGAVAQRRGLPMVAPPPRFCTDNAVMVAWAGAQRLRLGLADPLDHAPRPRWPLEETVA